MISKIFDPEKIAAWKASPQYAALGPNEKEIAEIVHAGAFDFLMVTVTTDDGKTSAQISLGLLARWLSYAHTLDQSEQQEAR